MPAARQQVLDVAPGAGSGSRNVEGGGRHEAGPPPESGVALRNYWSMVVVVVLAPLGPETERRRLQ